ncbi:hypothetical protein [Rhizobium sp. BK060]|uniref:hypothetical protein n=1 Tax=Rhizobium sp. BK060 TaxID=2587096 RepID=UPI001620F703|nr:hypothetical protein [Rhizobium sp. BK060]MBB3394480.1 hypothetical protein [Rhizobium sp. BK060]
MAKARVSKKRAALLEELEYIVGSECYNGSIQNWGPGGVFEGEGRSFRYPLTFIDDTGEKHKFRYKARDLTPEMLERCCYAFGANQLYIMNGLDKLLRYLEENHGLKI